MPAPGDAHVAAAEDEAVDAALQPRGRRPLQQPGRQHVAETAVRPRPLVGVRVQLGAVAAYEADVQAAVEGAQPIGAAALRRAPGTPPKLKPGAASVSRSRGSARRRSPAARQSTTASSARAQQRAQLEAAKVRIVVADEQPVEAAGARDLGSEHCRQATARRRGCCPSSALRTRGRARGWNCGRRTSSCSREARGA